MELSASPSGGNDGDANRNGSLPKKLKLDDDSSPGVSSKEVIHREADSSNGTEISSSSMNGSQTDRTNGVAEPEFRDEPGTSSGSTGEQLKMILDTSEAQYIDERTNKQMNDIEAEIKQNVPFISEKDDVGVLEEQYEDPIYIQKIADLKTKYRWLRRTRGDGNCFYRSLGLSLFENLMNGKDIPKANAFADFMVKCKNELLAMGYQKFAMEDFQEAFTDNLMRLMEQPSEETLLQIFQEQGSSDFIVVWLRFLTILQLRKEPEFYENFIDNYTSIIDFCRSEVEPMWRESDNIHIVAITSLLKTKLRVEYMDRGPAVTTHDFPEVEGEPQITLLYRPGHYDVLYRIDNESS